MRPTRVLVWLPRALGGCGELEAVRPRAVLWQRGERAVCEDAGGARPIPDLLDALEQALAEAGPLARAIGYFGYEFAATLEPLLAISPGPRPLPDAWWAVVKGPGVPLVAPEPWAGDAAAPLSVSLDDDAFRAGVGLIRERIAAGGVYQVNLTRRWSAPFLGAPEALFARLAGRRPPRLAAFVADREQGWSLLSLSPELLLARRKDEVETRPIKGTRPAGAAAELRASGKDAAELAMIVDLERNDLNRVCRPGSVAVLRRAGLVRAQEVVHLEARVAGALEDGVGWRELLSALLPGGSVTGAPKLAACRTIAALEPVPRGPYCGALGVLGRDSGTLALTIRTGVIANRTLHFHSGCGIVWDSDPAAEELESRAKVGRWLAALGGTHG